MPYVNTTSSIEVKVNADEADLAVSYNYGHKADFYLTIDGQTAHIELSASQLEEFIAGIRKVRGAMAGDD